MLPTLVRGVSCVALRYSRSGAKYLASDAVVEGLYLCNNERAVFHSHSDERTAGSRSSYRDSTSRKTSRASQAAVERRACGEMQWQSRTSANLHASDHRVANRALREDHLQPSTQRHIDW